MILYISEYYVTIVVRGYPAKQGGHVDLSVIVPCRDLEKYIAECLTSILAQDPGRYGYEVIVVIAAIYEYDAWGNCRVCTGGGVVDTDYTSVGHLNPFRYRGYYYDRDLGLYYASGAVTGMFSGGISSFSSTGITGTRLLVQRGMQVGFNIAISQAAYAAENMLEGETGGSIGTIFAPIDGFVEGYIYNLPTWLTFLISLAMEVLSYIVDWADEYV